jgi:putative transposase
VKRRRRRRPGATGTALYRPVEPNALWCADYKGEFMLGDRRYAHGHRFREPVAADVRGAGDDAGEIAFTVFERTFKEFGLPHAIRTDNSVPFASAHALFYGLSKLAVWWLRLGIEIERTKPGHPEQNGRHERMHLTLKKEATKPAAANVLQQSGALRCLRRPVQPGATPSGPRHEGAGRRLRALGARVSGPGGADVSVSRRHFTVTQCGRICFKGRKVNLSHVFAGQNVGVTQVGERVWLVTFMHYDLGYFDDETCRLEPIDNPFGPKVLPMCSE